MPKMVVSYEQSDVVSARAARMPAFMVAVGLRWDRRREACNRREQHGRRSVSATATLEEMFANVSFGYERDFEQFDKCKTCPHRIRWQCSRGHLVTAVKDSWSGKWCPYCYLEDCPLRRKESHSRKALSLQEFQLLARERGGLCLSHEYVNIKKPLKFQCSEGHQWEATAENVRRGAWCPECKHAKRRLTLDDMRKTAKSLGGKCLSENYINNKEKLLWRCAVGHVFEMAPNNIRRKSYGTRKPSWCPKCTQLARTAAVPAVAPRTEIVAPAA